jgi:hydrogenase maturation protease
LKKNILILCCGYPYTTDTGFGYHVWKALEKTKLPENVDVMEVGNSACMIPDVIEEHDRLIVIDMFHTANKPGSVVHLKQEEVPLKVKGRTDVDKLHLIDALQGMKLTGKCPATVFIGVVPVDTETPGESLTPEIESKVPVVIEMIMKEISSVSSD